MPTTSTQTVHVATNSDGSGFTASVTTETVETVQITNDQLVKFIASLDATPAPAPVPPATN